MANARPKKWLAVFLAFVLVLALIPGAALATGDDGQSEEVVSCQLTEGCTLKAGHEGECVLEEVQLADNTADTEPQTPEGDGINTLEELQAAIATGGEIALSGNIEIESANTSFSITNTVSIDLCGYSITRSGTGSRELFSVKNGGSLTIGDSVGTGAITSSYPVKLWSNSTFVLNGGSITSPKGAALDIFTSASNVTVEINGGSLTANADNTFGIRGSANVKIDITGGTITSSTNRLAIYISGDNDNAIELNIRGGTIENEGQAIQAYSGAVINVSGDASIHSETGTAISTQSGYGAVVLNVTGGSITTDGSTGYAIQAREESRVNISGGTVEGGTAVRVSDTATVNVTNGTLTGRTAAISVSSGDNPSVTVTGGTFSHDVEDYVPAGLETTTDENDNFIVTRRETVYVNGSSGNDSNTGEDSANAVETLEHALELVADGGTIYVCGTVTVSSSLTVSGVTIERAEGYTGSLISVSGSDAVLTLSNTVIDGKKAEGTTSSGYLVFITSGGTVNIEEGTQLINNNTTAVYVVSNAILNMNGGKISDNDSSGQSYGYGGAVYCIGGNVNLNSGSIENNKAPWGGAIMAFGGSEIILNGTVISGNTATLYGGGGIYMYGDNPSSPAVLEIHGGDITNNVTEYGTGGGIMGHYQNGEVIIKISDGTIAGNSCTADKSGSAISIYGANGSVAYPRLELSGSPEIVGDIFYQNDYEDGYVIHVTGEFTPVNPIEITRSNNAITTDKVDVPAVTYADGLTPNRDDFVSGAIFEGFVVDGQNLNWVSAGIIYFYDEDGTEFTENRHGVVKGETIDAADVPVSTKTGYTLAGWKTKDGTDYWNFEEDIVQASFVKLYAVWTLNAPTVSVTASDETPHIGSKATLTAETSHELDGVTYAYQWYKDGAAIADATGNTIEVSEAGDYTVKVTASDGTKLSGETESTPVEITLEDHIFGNWIQVESPSCTDKGSIKRVCTICEFTETAEVDPTGHEWEEEYTIDKAATCTEAGSKSIHCKNCDAVKDSEIIPATGHTAGTEWKSDKDGHWHECTVCGTKTDAASHEFEWVIDKAATATEKGLKHEECTVCGYKKDAVEIEASGTEEPEDPNTPQTGDSFNLTLWLTLAASVGLLLTAVTIFCERKRKDNR